MAWHKFYIVEMHNMKYMMPEPGRKMIKFGVTHHMDVMKRFDPNVDDGYVKDYKDWLITPKYSQVFHTKEEAEQLEKHLLHQVFPANTHKVWVEDYLQCESRDEYYHNTGITEIRLLTNKELRDIINKLKSTQSIEQRMAKIDRLHEYMKSY